MSRKDNGIANHPYEKWVDVLRGFGIILVVAGHSVTGIVNQWIFLFHMPLFFFLSGYVFHPKGAWWEFLKKRILHLLLPYAFFLILLCIPRFIRPLMASPIDTEKINTNVIDMLVGGESLGGPTGIFWFVTTLFLVQIVGYWTLGRIKPVWATIICFLALGAGYWLSFAYPEFTLPWDANVVLFALPIFGLGYFMQTHLPKLWIYCVAAFFAVAAFTAEYFGYLATMDLKHADYGTPALSLLAAVSIILACMGISKWLQNIPRLSDVLAAFGKASMIIMYTHLTFQIMLGDWLHLTSEIWIFLLSLVFSYLLYLLIKRVKVLRAFAMGSLDDLRSIGAGFRRLNHSSN